MHWHVSVGASGYLPDVIDVCTSVEATAEAIRETFTREADGLDQTARALAESGDYAAAWHTLMLAEELTVRAMNLDPRRADAPLYRNDPMAWHDTLVRLIGEADGTGLDYGAGCAYRRICVDQCREELATCADDFGDGLFD